MTRSSKNTEEFWNNLKATAKCLDAKYNQCLDVIFSSDKEEEGEEVFDDDFIDSTGKQIRRIVNLKDKPLGNTPLHYAVHNWPQDVIIRLLQFSANVAVKNNNGDIPLSYIPKETLEGFLNRYCLDIPGISDVVSISLPTYFV